jgi:hypothetical protein
MVQCDIFICHFPYFISESDCYKMLSRIYVHPVDHLYYCLKFAQIVSTPTVMTTQRKMLKKTVTAVYFCQYLYFPQPISVLI